MTHGNGPQGPQWGPQGPQGPQQGYYQQPPQQPKKKSKLKLVLIILGVLLLIGFCSAVTSGGEDSSEPASQPATTSESATSGEATSQPEETEQQAGLGEPVRDGKFEFVVNDVQAGVTTIGPELIAEQAQGQYVIVNMTVTNIGDKAQSYSSSNAKLFDAQGREFSSDSWASSLVADTTASGIYDEINPGNSAQVAVVFDVPVDAQPATLKLQDSMFSGGVEVALN